jgi:hypothetical protein
MSRSPIAAALALTLCACPNPPQAPAHRAEVRKTGANTVELVPSAGQLPFCLVYTVSHTGQIRQLTMTRENKSVKCEAGQPIGGVTYRIPLDEGAVKIHIFFSDQKLVAASVAQQVLEIRDNPKWSQLDLRLPGKVNMEVLDFEPSGQAPITTGGLIGDAGELDPDAGP